MPPTHIWSGKRWSVAVGFTKVQSSWKVCSGSTTIRCRSKSAGAGSPP